MAEHDVEALEAKIREMSLNFQRILEQERAEAQQRLEQERAERREQERKVKRRFVDRGLPPLGKRHGSTAEASVNLGHKEATLIKQQVNPTLKDLPLREPERSMIWTQHDGRRLDNWGSECDLQFSVCQVMVDAIDLAGLTEGVKLLMELGLTKLRPDIWVVTASGVPIGVVEVKRPSPTIMEDRHVHGQVFDYMRRIKAYFGVKHVLGIVTTYTEWRFCWFKESDHYATADTCAVLENCKDARTGGAINNVRGDDGGDDGDRDNTNEEDSLNMMFTQSDDGDEDSEEPIERDDSPRVLHGTKVYDSEEAGPELSVLLASIVYKMYKTPITPIQDVKDATMPVKCARSFFLLRDLGGGADGRAWRACTRSGTGCAIKFCSKRDVEADQRALLEAEAQVWCKAWKVDGVRVIRLAGQPALIMPYARAIKEPSNGDKQEVREAIDEMVSNGYCHEDLAWRHVGRLGLKQHRRRVIFFDLTNVSRVDADLPDSAAEAKTKMLRALSLN